MRLAFFCCCPAYTESSSGRGLPTNPCAVLSTRAKSFLSCAAQLPYTPSHLDIVALWKFATGPASSGRRALVGLSSPGVWCSETRSGQIWCGCPGTWCCPHTVTSPSMKRGVYSVLLDLPLSIVTPFSCRCSGRGCWLNTIMSSTGSPLCSESRHCPIWDPPWWCRRKLHDCVCGMDGRTVVCEQSEESWTEHTTLWRACVQDQSGWCTIPYSYHLRPVGVKVSDPEIQQRRQLPEVVLNAELKSTK